MCFPYCIIFDGFYNSSILATLFVIEGNPLTSDKDHAIKGKTLIYKCIKISIELKMMYKLK